LAYLNKNVKALAVSYDGGKKYVSPSVESAMDKTYPVVRPLYFYYLNKDQKKVTPFISYVLSSEGQKTVSEIGFIPVK